MYTLMRGAPIGYQYVCMYVCMCNPIFHLLHDGILPHVIPTFHQLLIQAAIRPLQTYIHTNILILYGCGLCTLTWQDIIFGLLIPFSVILNADRNPTALHSYIHTYIDIHRHSYIHTYKDQGKYFHLTAFE